MNRVWYASYGSNLSKDRFMCYIQGGKPEGATKEYQGCSNKDKPIDDKQITIPHELYFSKESRTWDDKAVAFIKSQRDENADTIGRMYLIQKEQFIEVVRQENSKSPDDTSITIDLNGTILKGETKIGEGWYKRVIYLGEEKGHPIFTFTATWDDEEIKPNKSGENYLCMIIRGLKETTDLNDDEIKEYLIGKDGIRGNIDEDRLISLIPGC